MIHAGRWEAWGLESTGSVSMEPRLGLGRRHEDSGRQPLDVHGARGGAFLA